MPGRDDDQGALDRPVHLDSLELARATDRPDRRPEEFELLGRRWRLLEGVFSPAAYASTAQITEWLPYPTGGRMLEVGCGAGVTSVVAALRGCEVTALDISPAAVRNTRINSALHGVSDRVRALESDLFSALGPDERFDLIVWNSNFVEAPADYTYASVFDRAFVDAGYATHAAFLANVWRHVGPGGRVVLGFSSRGNLRRLRALAGDAGVAISVLRRQASRAGDRPIERLLLELIRTDRAWGAVL
jgi:release factor glutamine methyltransferase